MSGWKRISPFPCSWSPSCLASLPRLMVSAEHRTTAQACAPIDREEIGRKRNWGARLSGNRRDWTAIDTEYLSTGRSNHLLSPLDRFSCLPLRNPGGLVKTLQRAIRGNLSNTTEWLLMVSSAQSLKLTPPGLWFSCFCPVIGNFTGTPYVSDSLPNTHTLVRSAGSEVY